MNNHTFVTIRCERHLRDILDDQTRTIVLGILQLVLSYEDAGRWVYRGVPNSEFKLFPSITRTLRSRGNTNDINEAHNMELRALSKFRHNTLLRLGSDSLSLMNEVARQLDSKFRSTSAPSLCASLGEAYAWTALMQHMGVPTRLVDWTESPWVALYFACSAPLDAEGRIYVLNRPAVEKTFNTRDTIPVQLLTFTKEPSLDLIQPVEMPYAFERINNQKGLFTIAEHPFVDHAKLLRSRLKAPEDFIYWRIPSSAKIGFRRLLASMSIAPNVLFPEIQSFAESLREEL